jgi:hypothetical protein
MARAPASLSCGVVQTASPTKLADSQNADVSLRVNAYSELAIRDTPANYYGLCEEGSLLLATNPTVSTGATWVAAQTAFSDTTPNWYIANNEVAGGRGLRLHYLKMIATAACTSGASIHYAIKIDTVFRAVTTDHILAITPVNPNGLVSNIAAPTVHVQNSATASVVPAASINARLVARGVIGGLTIAGDELMIAFGEMLAGGMAPTAVTQAGQPGRRVTTSPPIIIPPQGCAMIHIWAPSSSASFNPEFELLMSAR